jgi:chromosome segregation ATPase
MPKEISEYKSPPHKVIALLKKGRDQLREKYRALREKHRVAENQVRAVTKSRQMWRRRAEAAEAELKELKKKIANR